MTETITDIAKHRKSNPGSLSKLFRGDLDWIVMKSLDKDRSRRYETANELAQDIQRHLQHEPVLASPPGAVYRIRKFVRRNKTIVASMVIILLVLISGIIVSTIFAIKAQREAKISKAVNTFLNEDVLASVNPNQAKTPEVSVQYILDVASEKLEGKFQNEPLVEAAIRSTLGKTYESLDLCVSAEQHLKRAFELYREQFGPEHPKVLNAMDDLGWLYCSWDRYDKAELLFVKVLEIRRRVLGQEHQDTARSMGHLAHAYRMQGNSYKSEPLLVKALKIQQRILGEDHIDTLRSMVWLGSVYQSLGSYQESEQLFIKALKISQRILGEEHMETLWLMGSLAWTNFYLERFEQAEEMFVEVLEIRKRILGEEHRATLIAMGNLATMYSLKGRYNQAEQLYKKSLEIRRRVLEDEHPRIAEALNHLAWLQATCPAVEIRDGTQAIEYATRACEITKWQNPIFIDTLAAAYAEAGDFDAAVKWQQKAIELLSEQERSSDPKGYQERLKLYQSNKPYRESAESQYLETTGNVTGDWQVTKVGGASGDWQISEISDEKLDQRYNTYDDLYVALEDSSGHRKSVYAPEGAVSVGNWTEWIIPYEEFNGVNMSKIKKIAIGVGDPANPLKGKGMIYIDNISYGCGIKGYISNY